MWFQQTLHTFVPFVAHQKKQNKKPSLCDSHKYILPLSHVLITGSRKEHNDTLKVSTVYQKLITAEIQADRPSYVPHGAFRCPTCLLSRFTMRVSTCP